MKLFKPKPMLAMMLVLAVSASAVQAKTSGSAKSTPKVDPVQTQNQRHKTKHLDRKSAAKHLRVNHQQVLQAELMNDAHQHQGYSGRGRAGLPKTGGAR